MSGTRPSLLTSVAGKETLHHIEFELARTPPLGLFGRSHLSTSNTPRCWLTPVRQAAFSRARPRSNTVDVRSAIFLPLGTSRLQSSENAFTEYVDQHQGDVQVEMVCHISAS
jgi:hypothetical protein